MIPGGANGTVNVVVAMNPGAAAFNVEHGIWVEEQHRQMCKLRAALRAHVPDNELRLLVEIVIPQVEPLTEEQLLGIRNLQQSLQQGEDAISQAMEALQQSLADTIAGSLVDSSPNVANYMGQMAMAMAMGKLGTVESFVRQADDLRQQTNATNASDLHNPSISASSSCSD
ncbi:unnamed protein product [Sphagnum jensenii]|uniref:DOG1 domain-containing protein n=1 Tax=Sphagnum jensenii TaxID=128206 RepID=A0ABP1BZB7_9BRYO